MLHMLCLLVLLLPAARPPAGSADDTVSPPRLTVQTFPHSPVRLSQYDESLRLTIELTSEPPHWSKPPERLQVPAGASPIVTLTPLAGGPTEVRRVRVPQPDHAVGHYYQEAKLYRVSMNGQERDQWGEEKVGWTLDLLKHFKESGAPLAPGRYEMKISVSTGGGDTLLSESIEVVHDNVTLEEAEAANVRSTGPGTVWLRLTGWDAHGRRIAMLYNESDRPISVSGYLHDFQGSPPDPFHTLPSVEVFRPGGWQNFGLGYCGTGVGQVAVAPGKSLRLGLPSAEGGIIRYAQPFRFAGEQQARYAYSSAVPPRTQAGDPAAAVRRK